MSKQSLSVTFSSSCDIVAQACRIALEHDDILNGGSSAFELGAQIFYRAFPADNYSCHVSNGGTISVVCPEEIGTMTEQLTFDNNDEAALSHPIFGSFSYTWLGGALKADTQAKVTPNISAQIGNDKITVPYSVYGTVSVTYKYSYTSIRFSPVNTGIQTVLVCRICEAEDEQACASIVEDIESQAFEEVTLTIIDACEEGKVAGAQVVLDGTLIETVSGEDGKIYLGILAKGEHSIVVTAPGYVSSADDSLSNDSIIVG